MKADQIEKLGTNGSAICRQANFLSAERRLRESIDAIVGVWKFLPQFVSDLFKVLPVPRASWPALKAKAELCKGNNLFDCTEQWDFLARPL
jgi:hypothetical protein